LKQVNVIIASLCFRKETIFDGKWAVWRRMCFVWYARHDVMEHADITSRKDD